MKVLKLSIAFLFSIFAGNAFALSVNFGATGTKPGEVSNLIEILVGLTVITLAPSILIMMTSFTRFLIVFGFLRRALGLQTMPPDQILVGLSLFLTMFVMWPTFEEIYQKAYIPYSKNEGTLQDFTTKAIKPLRRFMFDQTRKGDLKTFLDIAKIENATKESDVPTTVLIPAFVISELTRAFKIGFFIYLPFFLVDMVVAAILMSMGMMMLPPVMISLPFKILLFVLVDGWNLLIINLISSFA